jgi:uncharacterized damage-inducible protein DinB
VNLEIIQHFYAFNEWANGRYFTAAAELSDEAFTRSIPSSFPSIRETLAHIVSAEWIWLQRWLGESPAAQPAWMPGASLGTLRRELDDVEASRKQFLGGLDATRVGQTVSFRFLSGKPGEASLIALLMHVVNHSTYHRGQLATLFRQVGAVPPGTDLVLFPGTRP